MLLEKALSIINEIYTNVISRRQSWYSSAIIYHNLHDSILNQPGVYDQIRFMPPVI